ncbi:MAG TPA: CRISPR-associated endonuclease Cas1 [Arachnia sp.]|nr:CRISPR-associated endonuclease Cas1 [Arachnia sp.]HMT86548.1 CRISPR-associated endonuclease Cas1 [Arachnia sp.]
MDIGDVVFVSTPGTQLTLEGDALRIRVPDRPGRHIVPLLRVDSLVLWHGVNITPEVLQWCTAHGAHVSWITQNGKLVASITGNEPLRAELRLAQYRAHENAAHRLELASAFVAGKLQNYRQLLLKAARDAPSGRQEKLRLVAEDHRQGISTLGDASTLTEVLGIEGQSARSYFGALNELVPSASVGRSRRPPLDPFNCYLSAGYALLRSAVMAALVHVGLDPAVGFLHGSRGSKPSLALDLMEEMRALLVDRLIATMFNRNEIKPMYWREVAGGEVMLSDTGWKHLLGAWVESRQREWPHLLAGRKVRAAEIPILQARLLARHLREPMHPYIPWLVA